MQKSYKILLAFSGLKQALTKNPGYNCRVSECREAARILLRYVCVCVCVYVRTRTRMNFFLALWSLFYRESISLSNVPLLFIVHSASGMGKEDAVLSDGK